VKADFSGAMVKVVNAKNEMVIGIEGIVVRETTRTFVVIQEDNSVKVLLKAGTVFQFRLPSLLKAKSGEKLAVNIWGDNIL
jgi:ribonuclease P protein subunit POP4